MIFQLRRRPPRPPLIAAPVLTLVCTEGFLASAAPLKHSLSVRGKSKGTKGKPRLFSPSASFTELTCFLQLLQEAFFFFLSLLFFLFVLEVFDWKEFFFIVFAHRDLELYARNG